MADRPYSRVYWSILKDPRFDGIRENATHLGAWLLLLVVADMAWPVPAYLPPPVPKASIRALATAGLIELRSGSRYIVHGLDAERERRSSTGSAGASARWGERNAVAMRSHSDRIARREQDEKSQDEASTARAIEVQVAFAQDPTGPAVPHGVSTDDAALAYQERTGRYPTPAILRWLDDIAKAAGGGDPVAGEARVALEIRRTACEGLTPKQYLERIQDAVARGNREALRREILEERERNAAKRAPVQRPRVAVDQDPGEAERELREYLASQKRPRDD